MDADSLTWRKSSYSEPPNKGWDNCVEVAAGAHAVHVRDSKDTARPGLTVAPEAWAAFVAAVTL